MIWLVCALVACKGGETLKTKATAIRDRALACKDVECVKAATVEFTALTKDVPEADLALMIAAADAIQKHERALEGGLRMKVVGISMVLPEGWSTKNAEGTRAALIAGKGEATFIVLHRDKRAEFATEDECKTRGLEQAQTGKLLSSKVTDGACLLHVIAPDNTDTHVAFIPDGAKTYYAVCDGPASATAECPKILSSWKAGS